MKRVKIMLISLSILAVVGGTLAFKARTGSVYCTGTPNFEGNCINVSCPNISKLKLPHPGDFVCSTTKTIGGTDACHDATGAPLPCGIQSVNLSFE